MSSWGSGGFDFPFTGPVPDGGWGDVEFCGGLVHGVLHEVYCSMVSDYCKIMLMMCLFLCLDFNYF